METNLQTADSSLETKDEVKPEVEVGERSEIGFVGGRKGGVGKTFLARHLAEYRTQRQQDFSLIEADVTIGDVGTVYGGYDQGATTSALNLSLSDDPKKYGEPDIIFKQVLEKKQVLVNLPAETNNALSRWIKTVNLLQLCEDRNIQIYYWFVTDGCYSSIRLLAESLKDLDGKLPHIVIRNQGRLNGMDFSYLDEEPLYQEILAAPNLVCVYDFPVLGSAEQFYLDKHKLTYQAGVIQAEKDLGVIQAQRVKTFVEDSSAVLDNVFSIDIPKFELAAHQRKRNRRESEQLSNGSEENETSHPASTHQTSTSTPRNGRKRSPKDVTQDQPDQNDQVETSSTNHPPQTEESHTG